MYLHIYITYSAEKPGKQLFLQGIKRPLWSAESPIHSNDEAMLNTLLQAITFYLVSRKKLSEILI